MKQVTNITLGGIVFAVEQDAERALAEYIEAVKSQLGNEEDITEIMADIERAMAEKLIAIGRNERRAVTLADVDTITAELGEPTAFGDSATDAAPQVTPASTDAKRRLYRDDTDAVLGGVASGLAHYFGIDPVLMRIAFVVATFVNGIGIIAYLILWVAVPKAETTAQRFAMRGKRVTLEDLTNSVTRNIAGTPLSDVDSMNRGWLRLRQVFVQIFALFGSVIRVVARVARFIGGVVLVIGGALGVAALIAAYSIILLSENTFLPAEAQQAVEILVGNAIGIMAMVASFIMMTIPLVVLIVVGASLLKRRNLFTVGKSVTLAVVWIIAVTVAGVTSALQVESVAQELGLAVDVAYEEVITASGERVVQPIIEPVIILPPEVSSKLAGVTLSPGMTELDVSGRGLTGSLPAEVRFLTKLERADLSNNNFTGLPAEVGQLSSLRYLNLANNQFTGLPHELGNLQNLEMLDLRGNNISAFDFDVIETSLPASTVILVD